MVVMYSIPGIPEIWQKGEDNENFETTFYKDSFLYFSIKYVYYLNSKFLNYDFFNVT